MAVLKLMGALLRGLLTSRAAMVAENLALRQQLGVLQRSCERPRLRRRDRVFWVWLSRLWPDWKPLLVIVHPATVIEWHHQGFKLLCRQSLSAAQWRRGVAHRVRPPGPRPSPSVLRTQFRNGQRSFAAYLTSFSTP